MTTQHPSQHRAIFIYTLMALFLCFEMALQVSPGVMTEPLIQELHLSPLTLGLMSGIYYISYTTMQLPSGLLYDRSNFRRIVTSAMFICASGILIFGLSQGPYSGALSRLLMGLGSAFAFLSVLTVAARCFDAKYFALLAGIAQLLAAIGGMSGSTPIALLVAHTGWRHTSTILAIIGFILMAITWFTLRHSNINQTVPAHQDESISKSLNTILQSKQTWYLALYVFLNWAPMTAFASLWGVPFLQEAYHLNTHDAASLISLIWLGVGLTSPLIGHLSDRFGRRNPFLLFPALIGTAAYAIIIYYPTEHIELLAILLFLGGSGSAGQIVTFAVIKDNNQPNSLSTAIGFNNMAMVASGFIMQPLVGKLIESGDSHALGTFQYALLILPASLFICALLTQCFVRETHCQTTHA